MSTVSLGHLAKGVAVFLLLFGVVHLPQALSTLANGLRVIRRDLRNDRAREGPYEKEHRSIRCGQLPEDRSPPRSPGSAGAFADDPGSPRRDQAEPPNRAAGAFLNPPNDRPSDG